MASRQRDIALVIVFLPLVVDGAIYLDDEPMGVTVEVGDEPRDDLLSPKVQAVKSVGPQTLPQQALGIGHFAAQLLRTSPLRR